jgi:DNA-directed RNA polymerase subunit L
VIRQISINSVEDLRFLVQLEEQTLISALQGVLDESQRVKLCYLIIKNVLKRDISRK